MYISFSQHSLLPKRLCWGLEVFPELCDLWIGAAARVGNQPPFLSLTSGLVFAPIMTSLEGGNLSQFLILYTAPYSIVFWRVFLPSAAAAVQQETWEGAGLLSGKVVKIVPLMGLAC